MDWNRTVLRIAGAQIDYLSIHHYYGLREMQGDPLNLMARPLYYERLYAQVADLLRELAPDRKIKLVVNEWNTALPLPRQTRWSRPSTARMMNVFERSGLVEMTAASIWSTAGPAASSRRATTPCSSRPPTWRSSSTTSISAPSAGGRGLGADLRHVARGRGIFNVAASRRATDGSCTSRRSIPALSVPADDDHGDGVRQPGPIETLNADCAANGFSSPRP
jgi:hypothetical protein